MFNLSTEHRNTLDLADCVMNSLETESPFISFYNLKLKYTVSYFLDNKFLCANYTGENAALARLFSLYWEEHCIASTKIALALENQKPVSLDDGFDCEEERHEHFATAASVILHVMDDFSILAEKLVA